MSTKTLLKLMVAFGLTALLLIFLGLNFVPRISAFSPANNQAANLAKFAGLDWIERHQSELVLSQVNDYSDWFERHPSAVVNSVDYAGSDYTQRHSSNLYDNSDWIERHPPKSIP